MESPITIALSRQMALTRKMDVVANNIANANTTAFKQQRMQFTEFLDRPAVQERISMVQDRGVFRDMQPGPLTSTGNNLDVAIDGSGYFVVDTVNGPRYTRAGHFKLDATRRVVDNNGLPVMGEGNRPITVPQDAGDFRIDSEGNLISERNPAEPIGRLRVVSFEREQGMLELGGGLYSTEDEAKPAPKATRVQQGMLEGSNVQSVVETTHMIDILRSYQNVSKLGQGEHDRQLQMIQRLGRPVA